jgi:hypothetical protein
MVVLAEQKFWRIAIPGVWDAPAPTVGGCGPPPDGKALVVRVAILEQGSYALGDRTTRDLRELGSWIDAAPRQGILCRMGEIRAQPDAPWRRVQLVIDLFRDRGIRQPDPWDTRIPSREERHCSPLPRPRPEEPRSCPGFVLVDYWSEPEHWEWGSVEEPLFRAEEALVAWLADRRLGHGLPAWAEDDMLGKAASLHAEEMFRMGYFGHFSPVPGSRSPSDRLAKLGWPEERRHAELLAKAETAEEAFEAIVKKPENGAVLADPAFRYAGVAHCGDCWVVLLGAER